MYVKPTSCLKVEAEVVHVIGVDSVETVSGDAEAGVELGLAAIAGLDIGVVDAVRGVAVDLAGCDTLTSI